MVVLCNRCCKIGHGIDVIYWISKYSKTPLSLLGASHTPSFGQCPENRSVPVLFHISHYLQMLQALA